MNKKSNLVVPCHWDYEVLEALAQQNREISGTNLAVTNMYGALSGEAIGNGRSQNKILKIARDDAKRFGQAVRTKGIRFNYLLNNSIPFGTKPNEDRVREYIDWIVYEFKPDALVIASPDLMNIIRRNYGDIPIHISTIAGVLDTKGIDRYLEFSPEKVVVHNDMARNFRTLGRVIEYTNNLGIRLEIMCTESCLRECPWMDNHRDLISVGGDDSPLQCKCNCQKISEPSEILRANFIRPEDLIFYEDMGINSFKITGRSKPAKWLPLVTRAYLDRDFNGNLIRLLGIDPNLKAEDWLYINNKALNGFIESFPRTGLPKDELEYCSAWAKRLFVNGDMKIDGFDYDFLGEGLKYLSGPEKLNDFRKKYYPRTP